METKELTCIGCPLGCQLSVTIENGVVLEVTGNTCKKGHDYGVKELTNPTRMFTSTIKVENGTHRVVSVKTKEEIPKGKMFECVDAIKNVCVKAPVSIGQVLMENIADTGISLIATDQCQKK